jgi:hypothetical protein
VAQGAKWQAISAADMMLVHVITPRAVETTTPEGAAAAAPVAAGGAEPEVIKKGKTEKEGEAGAAAPAKDKGKK